MKTKAKTVIITGASKGIGRAIAIKFAENGYNVLINFLNSKEKAAELSEILDSKGYSNRLYHADVRNRREVDEMINYCLNEFGGIDVLVNNAGISEQSLFTDISEQNWDDMIASNLKGVFNCTQSVLKTMLSNKVGKVINISSIWGSVGASCEVHYSTAKAGMIGFTKALAKELGPSNIQVNCIAPGIIETDMMSEFSAKEKDNMREDIPLGRFGSVVDVAEVAWFLASKGGDYITGQVISPNGGIVI